MMASMGSMGWLPQVISTPAQPALSGFVRQQLLVGVVHHLQLLQILGQSVVFGGQPCGGSFADLIRVEAGVHAPVDQLDGGLHRAQR